MLSEELCLVWVGNVADYDAPPASVQQIAALLNRECVCSAHVQALEGHQPRRQEGRRHGRSRGRSLLAFAALFAWLPPPHTAGLQRHGAQCGRGAAKNAGRLCADLFIDGQHRGLPSRRRRRRREHSIVGLDLQVSHPRANGVNASGATASRVRERQDRQACFPLRSVARALSNCPFAASATALGRAQVIPPMCLSVCILLLRGHTHTHTHTQHTHCNPCGHGLSSALTLRLKFPRTSRDAGCRAKLSVVLLLLIHCRYLWRYGRPTAGVHPPLRGQGRVRRRGAPRDGRARWGASSSRCRGRGVGGAGHRVLRAPDEHDDAHAYRCRGAGGKGCQACGPEPRETRVGRAGAGARSGCGRLAGAQAQGEGRARG